MTGGRTIQSKAATRRWGGPGISSVNPLVLLAGAVGLLLLSAGPAGGQTLEDAFVLAYETNPALMAARAELRQVDEQAPQARGGWRPQVSLSSGVGFTDVESESNGNTTVDDQSYPRDLSASVNQPLYTFGRVDATVKAADTTIEAQRADLFDTEQDTFVAAASAYLAVIREIATLDLQRANLERLLRQLEVTESRFAIEDLTRTDVAQAEARVAEARADVTRADADLTRARVTFERVIGLPPRTLTVPDLPAGLPDSRDRAVEIARAENFTLIQARFQERAAEFERDAAERELLPSVALVTELNRSNDTGGLDNESWTATATVRLSVPLYQAGVVYSQARAARENVRRLRFTAIEQERVASENAANAFELYLSNLSQFDALQAQIDAATIALEGVRQESAVGARTVIDVLDAEQDLLDAQVRLVQARHDALVSSYQLLAEIGRLTAQDLALPVEFYDFDRHYREVRTRYFGLKTGGGGYFGD